MDIASFLIGVGVDNENGSSTVDPVHTVTFMSEDGTEVLYRRSVVDGDDCADVVARGLLAKPTKESTPQYSYTHSWWSMTSGGEESSSALSSVTADRTVYATFTSAVRYYTITYLDDDGTVLHTESLAYGAMPSYEPDKRSGYSFDGWKPTVSTVTENAVYQAQWSAAVSFAGSTWEDISRVCVAGDAAKHFTVGDTRNITLSFPDDSTLTIAVQIVGIGHDDLADGSGKAGISVITVPVLRMSDFNDSSKPNYTELGCTYYSEASVWVEGYKLRDFLRNQFIGYLPEDLRAVIKEVSKQTFTYEKVSTTINDTVWMPSIYEYNGYCTYTSGRFDDDKYEYFSSKERRVKCNINGEAVKHGTRTPSTYTTNRNAIVDSDGLVSAQSSNGYYAAFGFCI